MSVYVDELRIWPHAWGPFRRGSSHLTADTLDELHAMAAALGMKRAWFQEHRVLHHYDLTAGRRAAAIRLGAVFVPMRAQIARRRAGLGPTECLAALPTK